MLSLSDCQVGPDVDYVGFPRSLSQFALFVGHSIRGLPAWRPLIGRRRVSWIESVFPLHFRGK